MKWTGVIVAALALLALIIIGIGATLPQAHSATRAAHFSQPPEVIWKTITTPEAFPSWRTSVKNVEPLPGRNGHISWREIDSRGGAMPYEVVEWIPPSRLVTRIADPNLPFGGTWTYEIQPGNGGAGSTLRITENGEVYNPFFRFVSRFIIGYHATMDGYLHALGKKFGETVRLEN